MAGFKHDPKKLDEAIESALQQSQAPNVHAVRRKRMKRAHEVLTRIKAYRASKVPKPN